MAINKKLIHFDMTKQQFMSNANGLNNLTKPTNGIVGNIPYYSVVFLKDGYIWTHGHFINGTGIADSVSGNVTISWSKITDKPSTFTPSAHTQSYTTLTGSGTTANQAIVSSGTANGWVLKTLGSRAFDSTSYLPLAGGTLTGNLAFSGDNSITWSRNTDYAKIHFKNTGDADSDSYLGFETGDNGNEYFRFGHNSGGYTEWMSIKSDGVRVKGTKVSLEGHTHSYLPLSGGTLTGNLILKGNTTDNMTYSGNIHPYIRFDNSDSSQNVSLVFTDYDSYRYPAGIKLVGNQGNEWFEAPAIYQNGTKVSVEGHNHDRRYLRNYHRNNDITSTEVVNTDDYIYNVGDTGGNSSTMTKPSGMGNAWGILHMHLHTGNYSMQLGFGGTTGHMYFRNAYNSSTFSSWKTLIDSDNIGSQSVASATKATLLKPIASTTAMGTSTWGIPSGCKQVWGQWFKDSTLTYTPSGGSATQITDSGDWTIWLAPNATANMATLNMRIDGTYYGSFSGNLSGNITGNSSTATKLQTARTLWGQNFNGSGNVSGNMTGVGSITASGDISTTSRFVSGLSTCTHIQGLNGSRVPFNSTAPAGYNMVLRVLGTGGAYNVGAYFNSFDLIYGTQALIDAGTNSYTHAIQLMNLNGLTMLKNLVVDGKNHLNEDTSASYRLYVDGTSYMSNGLTLAGGLSHSGTSGNFTWGNITIYGGGSNGRVNSLLVGDDVTIGDCNLGGIMGMKSTGNNAGFKFFNSSGTSIGGIQSTNGTLQWQNASGTFYNIIHSGNSSKVMNIVRGAYQYTASSSLTHTSVYKDGIRYLDTMHFDCIAGETYIISCKTDGTWSNHDTSGKDPSLKLCSLWIVNNAQSYHCCCGAKMPYVWTCPTTDTYKFRTNSYSDGTTALTIHFWDFKVERGQFATDWNICVTDPWASALKLTNARNISIADADSINVGSATSFDGTTGITLKLPSTIKAALNGNASTATKATQDSDGSQINTTYLKKSGGTMTGIETISSTSAISLPNRTTSGTRASYYTSGNYIHGGEDHADQDGANVQIGTWYGFGIYPTISGQTRTQGKNSFWHNARTGNTYTWGDYYSYDGTNNRLVLHTGNYTNYTVTKTGSGASGTWGINISGNAATATNTDKLDGYHYNNLPYHPINGSWKPSSLASYTRHWGWAYNSAEAGLASNGTEMQIYTDGKFWQREGAYYCLDNGNTYVSSGTGVINGATITQVANANRLEVYTETSNNTDRYRIIGQQTLNAGWVNKGLVLAVASRHSGIGIYTIHYGAEISNGWYADTNHSGTDMYYTFDHCYCRIRYFGDTFDTNLTKIICHVKPASGDNPKSAVFTFFLHSSDGSSPRISILQDWGGPFELIENGATMSAIDTSVYGQLKETTVMNESNSCTGNSATATKATQDSDGSQINTTYLKRSGGTMTGNITIGNSTFYASGTNGGINSLAVADDCILGDCNIGGHLGLKSLNTSNAGISFYNSSGGSLGRFTVNSSGTPTWNDTAFSLSNHNHDAVYFKHHGSNNTDPITGMYNGYGVCMTTTSGINDNWWHVFSAGWSNNNDWISQLALPTQDTARGAWFRIRQSSTNSAWIRLHDTQNTYVSNNKGFINNTEITEVNTADKLKITGYGQSGLTFYQTDGEFDGRSGWCHYIISNHGNGASYYHYTIGLPFWGAPIYRRQTDDTTHVTPWYKFITEENISSQSVNYANYSGYTPQVSQTSISSLSNFIHSTNLIYAAAGGSNSIADKPSGVDAFGVLSYKTASGWYGQLLTSSNTASGLYWRTAISLSGGWRKVLDNANSSVSKNGETLTVKINDTSQSLTNTWRGIHDNLTSTSTTESLSAKQGYLLANGSARDNTKLPLAGGTMVGTISASSDALGGGGFHNGYANIILRGNTTTGTSGIIFSSSKGDTSINRPSDCAFIQYHPYGISTATAVGTNPTIGTSGETGRFVIGIHNDSGDQLWLQTSAANDLKHVVGANVYTIYDSGNLPAYPTKASWNYDDRYSFSHSASFAFNIEHNSNYVTFDGQQLAGAPNTNWYNGFVSTHNNYLSSYLINEHRTSNWYVGYSEKTAAPTWYKLIHSGNYSSYALPLAGGTLSGEVFFSAVDAFRLNYGSYGVIHRNDGGSYWILLTNKDNQNGGFNSLRPFHIDFSTGTVHMDNNAIIDNLAFTQCNISMGGRVNATWGYDLNTNDYYGLYFKSKNSSSTGILFNDDGNVGINTLSPSYKLDVNGTLRVSDTITATSLAADYTDAWSDGTHTHPWYGYDHRYANTGVYSTTITDYFGMTLKTLSGNISITNGGNVGIGTFAPLRKLHVIGEAIFGESGYVASQGTGSNYAGTWVGQGFMELSAPDPYIDFHANKSTTDFTSRLIQWNDKVRLLYVSSDASYNGYILTCEGNHHNPVILGIFDLKRSGPGSTIWTLDNICGPCVFTLANNWGSDTTFNSNTYWTIPSNLLRVEINGTLGANYTTKTTVKAASCIGTVMTRWINNQPVVSNRSSEHVEGCSVECLCTDKAPGTNLYYDSNSPGKYIYITGARPYGYDDGTNGLSMDQFRRTGHLSYLRVRFVVYGWLE